MKTFTLPSLVLALAILTANSSAQDTPVPLPLESGDLISVAIAPETQAIIDVPDSFVGFGLFYSNLPSMIGRRPNRFNPHFPALMERLAQHQGTVPLRIGGGSVSETWYNPSELPAPPDIAHSIFPELLESLHLLLDTTGSQALFGLNASVAEPTLFQDMANGILDYIEDDQILAFELGNEPNRYVANGRRPDGYDFDIMMVESEDFLDRFETEVNTTRPIVGPTLTLFKNTLEEDPDWTVKLPEYIDEHGSRLGAISQNRYPSSDCATNPSSLRFASIENILDDRRSIGQAALFTDLIDDANDAGLPFWVHEHNTSSCGGTDGVSNTFASALWFLDATFAWVAEGVEKVFVPFVRTGFYPPFLAVEDLSNQGSWTTNVFPMFYGMEMFAQAAGADRVLIENGQISDGNVRAWITRDDDGITYVLLVNKDLDESGNAKVLLPGAFEDASAVRLLAPDASATSGITLGGLTWDGVSGPVPAGTSTSESISPNSTGLYELNLPSASAALLTIPPLDTSNLVIARPVVPSGALTGQTLLLEGEESFGTNLSYQWEQISGPELDITSHSEQLAAATFTEAGTYSLRLTVDNGNGRTNSKNFVVSVVPPPEQAVYLESNGTFSFEAENYSSKSDGLGNFANHEWVKDTQTDASGGEFMRVTPSESLRDREGEEAPALEYNLIFDTPGLWSVQVRMWGPDSDSDSLNIGFESPTTNPNGIRQRDEEWIWTGEVPGDGNATVFVPEAGEITFRVWPREDGVWIDRIALSLDASEDFSSLPESPLMQVGIAEELSATIEIDPANLSFDSIANQRYLIEGSTTLQLGDWVIESITEASGPLLTVPLDADSERKFFRVKELP